MSGVYLIKTDEYGTEEWSQTFGETRGSWGYSIEQTSDGGYIIAGGTSSFGSGVDVYLVKTEGNRASWTFMVYLNGDNNLEKIALKELNQMEKAGSTKDVNIVAMIDRHPKYDSSDGDWTGARMYHVTEDQDTGKINSKLLADLGEVNVGLTDTLSDFIKNATTFYPAQHYALILMDHGNGFARAT